VVKLDLVSTGIKWNSDTIAAKFSLLSGCGPGEMAGDFTINTKNLDYRIASVIHKLDLGFINQYLDDFSNFGHFSAVLNADIKSTGNFKDAEVLDAKGKVIISAFHFGKDSLDDYASFKKLVVDVNQLNPKNHKYLFDSVLLTHPFLKYEQYDYLDNFQKMFGKNGGKVILADNDPARFNLVLEIGKYIRLLSKNFLASNYQVNRFSLTEGEAVYTNYTLNEKFSLSASPLFISGDSLDKNHKRLELTFRSSIQPYGNATVLLSMNPKDSSDFDMTYHLQKFPLAMFNPYLVYYTSFPMDRGTLEVKGKWTVRNGIIKSTNHLVVIDPRLSGRLKSKSSKWIPMRLIMAIVKERGNVIDYEIPITGDLKKPKFHVKDVVLDVIENIFVNPATAPYRKEVRTLENGLERSVGVQWEMRKPSLPEHNERFMTRLADFLSENPAASVSVYPLIYTEKEKESILFYEAKKKYFLHLFSKRSYSFSKKDSAEVEKMQLRDKGFLKHLTACCNDSMLCTIQQKCYRYIGYKVVNARFDELQKKREDAFRFYFLQNKTSARILLHKAQNKVAYNGFSSFSIKYNGKIPPELEEAYRELETLDEKTPRKRYAGLRKKNKE
ncbi:MAG: DUF748 domain-containing protein, partial [Bacteroidia bacterium]|nr:DUF748 domain-containing protein [Bacteroidia bacterium]